MGRNKIYGRFDMATISLLATDELLTVPQVMENFDILSFALFTMKSSV